MWHKVESYFSGNYLPDWVPILHASSGKITLDANEVKLEDLTKVEGHHVQTMLSLSPIIENNVEYIAGFVIKKIFKKNSCERCKNFLIDDNIKYPLIEAKKFGRLNLLHQLSKF